jgi:hypothetical protein
LIQIIKTAITFISSVMPDACKPNEYVLIEQLLGWRAARNDLISHRGWLTAITYWLGIGDKLTSSVVQPMTPIR